MATRPLIAMLTVPPDFGTRMREYLERHGYDVRVASEAWDAERLLDEAKVSVAVAGPGETGLSLLRRHGGADDAPAFMVLTAGQPMLESVLALELGAADAVEAGITPREFAARIAGLLARRGHAPRELLLLESSTVDLRSALVMHRTGEEELLSPGQVAMLRLFISRPNTVLTRDDIIAAAPAEAAEAFDRSIDSRIVRLRRKLGTESIVTVRGSGYRFDPPGERSTRRVEHSGS
jgi:two-component system OmpR family response regulator